MDELLAELHQLVSDLEYHHVDGPDADGIVCNRCGRGTIPGDGRIQHVDGCEWARAMAIVEELMAAHVTRE